MLALLAAAATYAQAAEPVPLDIIVLADTPPLVFSDGDRPVGLIVDAVKAVAREAGFVSNIRPLPLREMIETVRGEDILVAGLFKSPDREALYRYSQAFMMQDWVMVMPQGAPARFTGFDSLKGKRIGYQANFNYGPAFEAATRSFLSDLDTNPTQRVRKLATGRVDAILIGPGAAGFAHFAQQAGVDPGRFVVQTPPVTSLETFMAMRHGARADIIIPRIDAALARLRANGTLDGIPSAYFQ